MNRYPALHVTVHDSNTLHPSVTLIVGETNLAMSPDSARNIARHLLMAADDAEINAVYQKHRANEAFIAEQMGDRR